LKNKNTKEIKTTILSETIAKAAASGALLALEN
jgi:hypothetical protein